MPFTPADILKRAEEYEDTKKEVFKATSSTSSKRTLNHNGKDVRKCWSNLNEITMHTWVTPPIIILSLTISSSKMSRSSNLTEIFRDSKIHSYNSCGLLFQEEFTTFTHNVVDSSLQGALEI